MRLAVFLVLFLWSCASTPGEEAEAKAHAENIVELPAIVVRVPDVTRSCVAIGARIPTGATLHGCSDPWGRQIARHCLIIVPQDDPGWIEHHERLHCKYGRWHSFPAVLDTGISAYSPA